MTDSDDQQPIEGEITGPDGKVSPAPGSAKGGKSGGKKDGPKKPVTGRGFGRQQTEEERKEENERSKSFLTVAARGEGWWKGEGWEPSGDDRLMVQMLKFSGYNDEDIASALHMSVETLLKHFEWELKHAKTLIMGDLATRAYTRARQGNDVMTIFLLKTRSNGAFSEKAAVADALTSKLGDVEGLSDEKKQQVVASLLDLLAPGKSKGKNTTKEGEDE